MDGHVTCLRRWISSLTNDIAYRYDMEFSGPLYPMTSFVRSVGLKNNTG